MDELLDILSELHPDVDFETEDPAGLCREIAGRIEEVHPELTARVFWDADYSFSE